MDFSLSEFSPHMGQLTAEKFFKKTNSLEWDCVGTLIQMGWLDLLSHKRSQPKIVRSLSYIHENDITFRGENDEHGFKG